MKLSDEITIPLPPEDVWPHIGNPARWLGFHPKVTAVRPPGDAEPVLGTPYEIDFTMGSRREASGTVGTGATPGIAAVRGCPGTATLVAGIARRSTRPFSS